MRKYNAKRWLLLLLALIIPIILISACVTIENPQVNPTESIPITAKPSILSTETTTPTPIWFPPTPTNTPYVLVTREISPTVEVKVTTGEVILTDNFTDASSWTTLKLKEKSATVTNGELTLAISEPQGSLSCVLQQPELRNFYLEITASPSLCKEKDEYGILYKYNDGQNFFRFIITCDGRARVDRLLKGEASSPFPLTFFGAIPPGAPSSSQLAILVKDGKMQFYINHEFLTSLRDENLPEGTIGVYARAAQDSPVTVNFSDLKVYETIP
jgi:hypothetical protein